MAYSGYIRNGAGKPIPHATLGFYTPDGALITTLRADQYGVYEIDPDFDGPLLDYGNKVIFSAPGYSFYTTDAVNLAGTFTVTLVEKNPMGAILAVGGLFTLAAIALSGKKVAGHGSFLQDLPPWAKGVLVVGGGAALYFAMKGKGEDERQREQLPDAAAMELQKEAAKGVYPTLSTAELQAMAAAIVNAADDWGTNEDAIYSAFANLQNSADFWALVKVYGVRSYKGFFEGGYFGNVNRNLAETIVAEFNSSERAALNSILQQIGIDYKF